MDPDWGATEELILGSEGFVEYIYDDKSRTWPRRRVRRAECYESGGQYKVGDSGGTATLGFGETRSDILDRYWDRTIARDEALAIFRSRVVGYWQGFRDRYLRTALNPNQAAACTSFSYQAGAAGMALYAPDLLSAINDRRFEQAARIWLTAYIREGSVWEAGLRNRRRHESAVFARPWAGAPDPWASLFVPVLLG